MQKEELAKMIDSGLYCCAVSKNDIVMTSNENGIKPLFQWLKSDRSILEDCHTADKIIGKAAALLLALGRVKSVYGKVMSESAIAVFEQHNIPYTYTTRVEYIINRAGTGMCPMEETVCNISNPDEAFEALQRKIDELMKAKHN